jgi:predicted adenylyl cyclase CyaB
MEYEYAFKKYNKKKILSQIQKLGGTFFGHFIFKVIVFIHPLQHNKTYIRVRDEGYKCTMTTKTKTNKSQFSIENEVIIDDFNEAVKILYSLGCKKKYYYEKMREIWKIKDTEIIFDIGPGIPEIMEVEAKNKRILDNLVKQFGIKKDIINKSKYVNKYKELYDFYVPSDIDLTFDNVKRKLSKYVKKNKKLFDKLVIENKKLYKSLL